MTLKLLLTIILAGPPLFLFPLKHCNTVSCTFYSLTIKLLCPRTLFKLPFRLARAHRRARAFRSRNRGHLQMDAYSIFPLSASKIFFSLVQHKLSHNYDAFVPVRNAHWYACTRFRWAYLDWRPRNGVYTLARADDSAATLLFGRVCARQAIILCR